MKPIIQLLGNFKDSLSALAFAQDISARAIASYLQTLVSAAD